MGNNKISVDQLGKVSLQKEPESKKNFRGKNEQRKVYRRNTVPKVT